MNLIFAIVAINAALAAEPPPFLTYDPATIITNESTKCAICHPAVVKAWSASNHQRSFGERHRTRKAAAINKRLGKRSLKRSNECVLCHYTETPTIYNDRGRHAESGVSCQRCHGPAVDWYPAHNKQDPDTPFADRAATLETLGMRHRFSLYELYATCYQCHSVPREQLVNDGRHPAGSLKFELVAWSEGEVRHRYAPNKNTDRHNVEAPLAHRRFLFILGKALDLEYGLRAIAYAEESGRYARNERQRVVAAHFVLSELNLDIPEIKHMLEVSSSLLNNAPYAGLPLEGREEYVRCATKIGEWAKQLEDNRADYAQELKKVDVALPKNYRGPIHQTTTAPPR